MTIYSIDTAEAVTRISSTGLTREQAEAIVATFAESNEQVATKTDIDRNREVLEAKIDALKNYLLFRIALAQLAGAGLVFALIKFFG